MIRRILTCIMFCSVVVFGQSTTATISGTMLDPQGNALSSAKVKITNLGTGVVRETTTNSTGFFRVPGLPSGRYDVMAEAQGFTAEKRADLMLAIAEEAVVNFIMKVGVATEQVTIDVQPVNVETTSSTLNGLVDEKKIRDLPLDGRDMTQLIFLQPGVVESRGSAQTANTGRGSRFSVGGARPSQNLFQIDGTTINDALSNTPGSAQGLLIGVETIKEFRVLTNTFNAEYSRAAGGVFIAVTKSGTNEFHGSAFDFLRNDALDARQFFDRCTSGFDFSCNNGGKPEFRRNQFGGAIGGPIIKDKTFFFGSYEGLREFKGITTISNVPDSNARLGILPTGNITVDPRSVPLLNFFPVANGPNNGDGTAQFIGVTPRPSNGDFYTLKVDHQLSPSDSLSVRYLLDDSDVVLPRFFPQFPNQAFNRKTLATIEERKFIGPRIVNEARFGFNRSTPQEQVPLPSGLNLPSFIAGQSVGALDVGGLSTAGTDRTNPKLFFENDFQGTDDVFINLGRNDIKTGVSFDRFQFNGDSESRSRGRLRFKTLQDLLTFNVQALEGSTSNSDFRRGYRQNLAGFFLQDDFKLTKRLTINLGARYEVATNPTEVDGKISNLRSVYDPAVTVGGDLFKTPKNDIAPRFGFAYDVFGDGKTALRGGFGIYYDQPLFNIYRTGGYGSLPFVNTASLTAAQVQSLPLPSAAFGPGATQITQSIQYNLRPSYTMQYNLNIQRELVGTVLSIAYVGSRGVNLYGESDLNVAIPQIINGQEFFAANLPLRNPNFGALDTVYQGFSSNYNGLTVSANRRFIKGLQAQISYTYGKSLDNRSGSNGRQEFNNGQARGFDPLNRSLDYGLSNFDVRNNFTANATYELPFGKRLKGIAGGALNGWQINTVVKVASGIPFTPLVDGDPDRDGTTDNTSRPNQVGDPNSGPHTPDQWFNYSAFAPPTVGFRGTAGRNTVIGPNFRTVDLSMDKMIPLTERLSLQFRAEAFNLFNRANFGLPSNSDDGADLFTFSSKGTFSLIPTGGQITTIVGSARELQFALKLIF